MDFSRNAGLGVLFVHIFIFYNKTLIYTRYLLCILMTITIKIMKIKRFYLNVRNGPPVPTGPFVRRAKGAVPPSPLARL